jgi:hypothetical protein
MPVAPRQLNASTRDRCRDDRDRQQLNPQSKQFAHHRAGENTEVTGQRRRFGAPRQLDVSQIYGTPSGGAEAACATCNQPMKLPSAVPPAVAAMIAGEAVAVRSSTAPHSVAFFLVKPEPTRGLEPRTFRLQGAQSVLAMLLPGTSLNPHRSGRHSGSVGREFARHTWCHAAEPAL